MATIVEEAATEPNLKEAFVEYAQSRASHRPRSGAPAAGKPARWRSSSR